MQSWLDDFRRLSSASSGSPKGQRKGTKGSKGDGRFVRRRIENDRTQLMLNAVNATAQNSAANSRAIRMMSGFAFQTALCPRDPTLEMAAALEPIPEEPIEQHIATWGTLFCGCSQKSIRSIVPSLPITLLTPLTQSHF
jgi:hypothetical protein